MAMRLPVDLEVEYRGVQAASEFVSEATSEVVQVPARAKFEYEDSSGDVFLIPVSGRQLDRATPPVDYEKLKKGDRFHMRGFAVLQDRGAVGRDGKPANSYLTIESLVPLKAGRSRPAESELVVAS